MTCHKNCTHSPIEHSSFDSGKMAARLGYEREVCPHKSGDLRDAWLVGWDEGDAEIRKEEREAVGRMPVAGFSGNVGEILGRMIRVQAKTSGLDLVPDFDDRVKALAEYCEELVVWPSGKKA